MYTLHRFLGVSNLEHAPVDLTCVRKGRYIKQKLDKKKIKTEWGREKKKPSPAMFSNINTRNDRVDASRPV
jgi:hypothetical protein